MTTPLLPTLARLFGEGLSRPPTDYDTNFFSAGGDSLAAGGVLSRIEEELGVQLLYRDFLEAPTPVRLGLTLLKQRARERGGDLVTEITALSADDASVFLAHLKASKAKPG